MDLWEPSGLDARSEDWLSEKVVKPPTNIAGLASNFSY